MRTAYEVGFTGRDSEWDWHLSIYIPSIPGALLFTTTNTTTIATTAGACQLTLPTPPAKSWVSASASSDLSAHKDDDLHTLTKSS